MARVIPVVRALSAEDTDVTVPGVGQVSQGQRLGDVRRRSSNGRVRIYVTPDQKALFAKLHKASGRSDHAQLSSIDHYDVSIEHLKDLSDDALVKVSIETHYEESEQAFLPKDVR